VRAYAVRKVSDPHECGVKPQRSHSCSEPNEDVRECLEGTVCDPLQTPPIVAFGDCTPLLAALLRLEPGRRAAETVQVPAMRQPIGHRAPSFTDIVGGSAVTTRAGSEVVRSSGEHASIVRVVVNSDRGGNVALSGSALATSEARRQRQERRYQESWSVAMLFTAPGLASATAKDQAGSRPVAVHGDSLWPLSLGFPARHSSCRHALISDCDGWRATGPGLPESPAGPDPCGLRWRRRGSESVEAQALSPCSCRRRVAR
jgi:hypothetical protein